MKRLALLIGITCLLSSCQTSVDVISRNAYSNTIEQIKKEVDNMGYALVGYESENRVSVEVAESEYIYNSGYSQRMDNIQYIHETYYFKDDNGNELSFKTVLRPEGEILLNVSMEGCKTSNIKDYTKLCGNNSPIKKQISNLKPDTTTEVLDKEKSILLACSIGLVGIGLVTTIFPFIHFLGL